jgi:hypothetical protein
MRPIVFDEHLLHSSDGGAVRHQWRVDYLARPLCPADNERVIAYFAAMFSPDRDGGYDVNLYPTHGENWRRWCPPNDDRMLETLGAYAATDEEERTAHHNRRSKR